MASSYKTIIWGETKGRCVYCGEQTPPPNQTIDHVVPTSRGGKGTLDNLAPACGDCNTRRGLVYPPHVLAHPDFVEYVKAKENAHYDFRAVRAERAFRQPIAKKNTVDKVMVFFEGGTILSSPEGIKVKVGEELVAILSWADIASQFYLNFDFKSAP